MNKRCYDNEPTVKSTFLFELMQPPKKRDFFSWPELPGYALLYANQSQFSAISPREVSV